MVGPDRDGLEMYKRARTVVRTKGVKSAELEVEVWVHQG